MTANELISKYPDGVPVLEVAKFIGLQAYHVRKKAENLNGQVNFDRESDKLSAQQLQPLLRTYIEGQRQLKGEKRSAVEQILKVIGGTTKPITKGTTKQITKAVIKKVAKVAEHRNNFNHWLESAGLQVIYFISSTLFVLAYYTAFILTEGYFHAEFFSIVMGWKILPSFVLSVFILLSPVLLAIGTRGEDTVLYSWLKYDYKTRRNIEKPITLSDASEFSFWIYNIAMITGRIFIGGSLGSTWKDVLFVVFAIILSTVLLIASKIVKAKALKLRNLFN